MPFCTRTPMGSPPQTVEDLRADTQAFVRKVLPGLDVNDSLAFESIVENILDEFKFITDFDHVV